MAMDLAGDVELRIGHDDNIDRKESGRETPSSFLSTVPAFSLQAQMPAGVTLAGGYELAYTRYLAEGLGERFAHRAWGDVTKRLRPGLFADLNARLEALNSPQNREDEGWGFSLTPGLTYHLSDRLSARFEGSYGRWRYDSLDFDTGRAIVRLQTQQVDNRYAVKLGLVYLVSPGNAFGLAYRVADNRSNNAIDEYVTNAILARADSRLGADTRLSVEYDIARWNYFDWHAGRMLRGKLRDDLQQHLRLELEHALSPFTSLLFDAEMTINDSNLAYQSYERRLIYAGLRFNW